MSEIISLDQERRTAPEHGWDVPAHRGEVVHFTRHHQQHELLMCSNCGSRQHRASKCPANRGRDKKRA